MPTPERLTELRDSEGRLVAKVSQIQAFSYPRA
jgi:hypothetical protein